MKITRTVVEFEVDVYGVNKGKAVLLGNHKFSNKPLVRDEKSLLEQYKDQGAKYVEVSAYEKRMQWNLDDIMHLGEEVMSDDVIDVPYDDFNGEAPQ